MQRTIPLDELRAIIQKRRHSQIEVKDGFLPTLTTDIIENDANEKHPDDVRKVDGDCVKFTESCTKKNQDNATLKEDIHLIYQWFLRHTKAKANACYKVVDCSTLLTHWNCNESFLTGLQETLNIGMSLIGERIWYRECRAFTVNEIISCATQRCNCLDTTTSLWNINFLPFAADIDNNLLIIVCASSDSKYRINDDLKVGGVYEWDDISGVGELLAPSFIEFLSIYRRYLYKDASISETDASLSVRGVSWIDEVGVIEEIVTKNLY